jgi:DNA repair protein RadC
MTMSVGFVLWRTDMRYEHHTTLELVSRLIGIRAAKRLYRDSLTPLFVPTTPEEGYDVPLIARELVQRWLREEINRGPELRDHRMVQEYLSLLFAGEEREVFVALYLDSRNRIIATERLFFGTIDGTSVHPREVVKAALRHNAAGIIFSHNHPSGIAEPSMADELITRRLKEALAFVDIHVVDHLIVGTTVESFAERGLL